MNKSQQVLNRLDKTWRALEESYAGLHPKLRCWSQASRARGL